MNEQLRIDNLRKMMEAKEVSGIFIANDASFEYFTGINRGGHDNTKQRQNSLEYASLLITQTTVTVFYPRLSALGFSSRLDDFPVVNKLVLFNDEDLYGKTFISEVKAQGLNGKKLAVNRDISSTLTLTLQQVLEASVMDMSESIDKLRAVKDADELVLMRESSRICDEIYRELLNIIVPGMKIRDVELAAEHLLEGYGASYTSFSATVLNHGPKAGIGVGANYEYVDKDHTIALDFGVTYKGYCSDFGRTIFIQEPTKEMIKIHDLVMASQKAGMEALIAGKSTGADCNAAARQVIEDAGYGENFIHRLGHGIGKDVHERPFLSKGEALVVQPNMCFTVEPSIYVPQKTLVRVEDVVLVTDDGCECLNKITKEIVVL